MNYLYLVIAIIAEVSATAAIKASAGFTRLVPSAIVIIGYGISFYLLSKIVEQMSLGIVYAIWCGVGIVLVALISHQFYHQALDLPALIGILLIIAGVIIINLFSQSIRLH
ncbi:DMT family transporter [Dongshaea marina]|uniref:DMT family transporter n=1 Tax=Dongshaea marina TaxID=2047966 RepID=UPI000D3ECB16|nr:multidrug efflux SMR transporter [Dongshaea marina]